MDVIEAIRVERQRQIEAEGWTPEHDDQHGDGALAAAAACYAIKASRPPNDLRFNIGYPPPFWPGWATKWWKPKDRRTDLIRAGALIVAEIERLDRAAARKEAPMAHIEAAAPALLKALHGMVDAYWRGSEDSDDADAPAAVKDALAAIALAEGRPDGR